MRRLALLLGTVVLLAALAAGTATGARGRKAPPPPQFPNLAGTWSHAEINVTIRGVEHTLILDRGRITQVSATQLKLHESGDIIVAVPLSPSTIIAFRGFGNRPAFLRKGLFAETMRIDTGAAVRVRVTRRP
jgi:hypothetical protein